ncbi:MAG: hypothetical protein ACK5GN_14500 [Pseudomonadota bacterium]|jgi:hypothetical protein
MKANHFSKLPQQAGITSLVVGALAEVDPQAYGNTFLALAGLDTLGAVKDAILKDPGLSVAVSATGAAEDAQGYIAQGYNWLVVESSGADHRGTLLKTAEGASALVWSILAMQDTASLLDAGPQSSPDNTAAPMVRLEARGPLGPKKVTMEQLNSLSS